MTQYLEKPKRSSRLASAWRLCTSHRHGFKRLVNTMLVKLQTALGTTRALGMPTCVSIELTNCCDGGCVLCPVGEGRVGRSPGRMSLDSFRRIIDEISGHATYVSLYNWGDPMMHPQVYEMIEYVKARKIPVSISSNLHQFRVEDSERLVKSGLDSLAVSIHGLSEETYQTYQPRHELAKVVEKVKAIVAAKQKLASLTPDLHFMFIVRKDNEHEAPRLAEFSRSMQAGYRLLEASLNLRLLPLDRTMKSRGVDEEQLRQERLAKMEQWLPRDDAKVNPVYRQIRQSGGKMPQGPAKLLPCRGPWYEIIVSWDGDVSLCCGCYEPKDSVGNVLRDSVRRIWNNPKYKAARRSIRNRSRANDPYVICRTCPGMLL